MNTNICKTIDKVAILRKIRLLINAFDFRYYVANA